MKNRATVLSLAIIGVASSSSVALAESRQQPQEAEIYAGQSFGDDLLDRNLSGRTPKIAGQ